MKELLGAVNDTVTDLDTGRISTAHANAKSSLFGKIIRAGNAIHKNGGQDIRFLP